MLNFVLCLLLFQIIFLLLLILLFLFFLTFHFFVIFFVTAGVPTAVPNTVNNRNYAGNGDYGDNGEGNVDDYPKERGHESSALQLVAIRGTRALQALLPESIADSRRALQFLSTCHPAGPRKAPVKAKYEPE